MKLIQSTSEHLDSLSDFYYDVVEYLQNTINYPCWTHNYPNKESVKNAISNGEQYMYVADGELLGAVVLNEEPGGKYEIGGWSNPLAKGEYLVVHTLAVSPNKCGQGIGGRMVDLCIELARSKGYKGIRLDVVPKNTPAAKLYTRKGFRYVGTGDLERGIKEIPQFDLYELDL